MSKNRLEGILFFLIQDHNIVTALNCWLECQQLDDAEEQVQISGETNPLYTT